MAAAYDAASEGRQSPELVALTLLDRFGAQAVFGRMLTMQEMNDFLMAEETALALASRNKSGNWEKWAESNPRASWILFTAEQTLSNE